MERIMFENISLEPEQKELLSVLVEAARNLPSDKRQPFFVYSNRGQVNYEIHHPGLPNGTREAYPGDLQALLQAHLLSQSLSDNSAYEINSVGFQYYAELKRRSGEPVGRMQELAKSYLQASHFSQKYPQAYQKWVNAESLLWSSDSEAQLTTIGHLCREALQEFATSLVNKYKPPEVDKDVAHTEARIRAALDSTGRQISTTVKPFLDALLAYWRKVSDLVQRQEHGGQREGKPLIWEDGRLVVFQTLVVMFEIDSCISHRM
jgi:hypothetical protein